VVIWSSGLTGVAAGVVFLLAVMPSAIVTFVFAERYQKDAGAVAGSVVMSTVITFLFMPGLIWIALRFAAGATP
jgi:predicted permease